MMEHSSIGLVLGYTGIGLSLLSTFMRSMQPLRMVAIVGNICGLTYGFIDGVWPTFFGNMMLLPINSYRLWEIRRLAGAVMEARSGESIINLLLPHMHLRHVKAGTVLFNKGDPADVMYYLRTGDIRLIEIDKHLSPQTLFGEAGLFTKDSLRTLSAVCETDCELYDLTREHLFALYFQNPQIGFNLMQYLVESLLDRRPPPPPPLPGFETSSPAMHPAGPAPKRPGD